MIKILPAREKHGTRYYLHISFMGSWVVISRQGISWTPKNDEEHSVIFVTMIAIAIAFCVILLNL